MNEIIHDLNAMKQGKVGIDVYSPNHETSLISMNTDLVVPLASAAKVAFGFAITKMAEDDHLSWDDLVENIRFDENEDSKEPSFSRKEYPPLKRCC